MATQVGIARELWRYPVMGLRGESVREAEVVRQGILGDRAYVLYHSQAAKVVDPVKYGYSWGETTVAPGLLELQAAFDSPPSTSNLPSVSVSTPDGKGISSGDPEFEALLGETLHFPLKLMNYPAVAEARPKSGRALHILTLSSLRAIKQLYPAGDFDVRRFRPNIVIDTPAHGFPEESWVGSVVSVGTEVTLKVEKPNQRCRMTTMKQGDVRADDRIHETISTKHNNILGAMCNVVQGGSIRVGDAVELLS